MGFYDKFGTNWFNNEKKNAVKLENYYFYQKGLILGIEKTFWEELLSYELILRVPVANQLIIGYCA